MYYKHLKTLLLIHPLSTVVSEYASDSTYNSTTHEDFIKRWTCQISYWNPMMNKTIDEDENAHKKNKKGCLDCSSK